MTRFFKTAERLDSILSGFPKLRGRIDSICVQYHQIKENFNYDINTNGERWLLQTLAGQNRLENVFDVGANHGDWAASVLKVNPDAMVHCFEICPPTFLKLSARLSAYKGDVILNPFGLSDSAGEIKIRYCPEGDGGTTMFDTVLNLKTETISAKVAAGKGYCVEHDIKRIDLVKLDVEGAEHLVLRGFEELLNPVDIPVVQFEYGMVNILTKFLLRDFYQFFDGRGYQVGKLFPESVRFRPYRFEDEDFLGPNYVAVSPQIAPLLAKLNTD